MGIHLDLIKGLFRLRNDKYRSKSNNMNSTWYPFKQGTSKIQDKSDLSNKDSIKVHYNVILFTFLNLLRELLR